MTETYDPVRVSLTGCAICGDPFEDGDLVRTWRPIAGVARCHDACYLSLSTHPATREQRWPRITGAPVETYDTSTLDADVRRFAS